MPYIKVADRRKVDVYPNSVSTPGELNYLLTKVILKKDFFDMDELQFKLRKHCCEYYTNKKNYYQTYNDIIGALNCCSLEFSRRFYDDYGRERKTVLSALRIVASNFYIEFAVPYEDKKIVENGDVI